MGGWGALDGWLGKGNWAIPQKSLAAGQG